MRASELSCFLLWSIWLFTSKKCHLNASQNVPSSANAVACVNVCLLRPKHKSIDNLFFKTFDDFACVNNIDHIAW